MYYPQSYLTKLREGKEEGLEYYYSRYFRLLHDRVFRITKNDLAASTVAQEAFLRLWIFRQRIGEEEQVWAFLWQQAQERYRAWFRRHDMRFFKSLVQLDAIDGYQDFLAGYSEEEDEPEYALFEEDALSAEEQAQWQQIQDYIPSMDSEQQYFLQLCLRYSFHYEQIASRLGGISSYTVGRRVETLLEHLKKAVTGGMQLDACQGRRQLKYEGELNEEQAEVLRMRFDLQHSFEEIAAALKLPQGYIQKVYVQARLQLKKGGG
ncbi:sigma-70 family RNA polymerase sigma factor [Pararcticibacter amylolyticus]|uniref:RNA polymerase sigma-70 region 4 domain-containing protein n=1 Tax=Pararcticibacter amylolyticus TaxID=2173175 RepID=A0A2U2P9U9_9SPHI|nr:sigma-70 family RNA polymerase sigma factor [Pararcticibacter amylolyticus]PWG78176.1 hypothetical protein DDR33_23500 [Pararcticibacter amylolyticus]